MTRVEYYFAPISGFAYLGHRAFLDIATSAGAEVIFRPIDIPALFTAQGTVPPPKQGELRLSYRREDMARWAARRGLPFNPIPAHWPGPAAPACKAIIAAGDLGHDMGRVAEAFMEGIWAKERDLANTQDLEAMLNELSLPAADILADAASPAVDAKLASNADGAQAAGVFGSPTYVVEGVRFFGQDRLDFLADALAA